MKGLVERWIVGVWTCERKKNDGGMHRGLIDVISGRKDG